MEGRAAGDVSKLVNVSGVNLLLSDLLGAEKQGMLLILFSQMHGEMCAGVVKSCVFEMCAGSVLLQDMETLNSDQRSVAWGLGVTQRNQLTKLATTPALVRLYQLLLFTMPGTPVFTYGDEIGLQAGQVGSTTDLRCWKQKCWPRNSSSVHILFTLYLTTRVQILRRWSGTQRNPAKKTLATQQLTYVF